MPDCHRVFYHPDRRDRGSPADHALDYEDVFFETRDGSRLHGWFLPAAGGADPRGTVLHLHGNAANITGHYEFTHWLPTAGYHVLTFDYRGYGRSEGCVTRAGTIEDAAAALDFLRGRPDVDPGRIVVWGQSLGGAVSIVLAARRRADIRALAVEGAFSGYRQIVRHHVLHHPLFLILGWWLPFVVGREWDPIDHVAEVSPVPILFLHGRADRVVPWSMAQALYERAKPPKDFWLIDGADHYEPWETQPETARRRLLEFFGAALAARPD